MDFMDKLWLKVKIAAGACAGNVQLSDLHDYLEKGEQVSRGASFIEKDATRAQKLIKGADALGDVRKGISTTQGVCMDVQAIVRIQLLREHAGADGSGKPLYAEGPSTAGDQAKHGLG